MTRPMIPTTAFSWDDESFTPPPRQITGRWYQKEENFMHVCGSLTKGKNLSGWIHPDESECSCCGTACPESVLMLIQLQKLNNV